jgi:hypothetical protein
MSQETHSSVPAWNGSPFGPSAQVLVPLAYFEGEASTERALELTVHRLGTKESLILNQPLIRVDHD